MSRGEDLRAVPDLDVGRFRAISRPWPRDAARPSLSASPDLVPFLKWPGGKTQELPAIADIAPALTGRYIDPFVGGGSVLLAVPEKVEAWANDAAEDLIELYRAAAERRDAFRDAAWGLARAWEQLGSLVDVYTDLAEAFVVGALEPPPAATVGGMSAFKCVLDLAGPGLEETFLTRLSKDLPWKFQRMRNIQTSVGRLLSSEDLLGNVEGAVRAAFYMAVRARYNSTRLLGCRDDIRLADFFFLREFAYAAMFRFNARGEFNVPYGGISYNRKSFAGKVDLLFSPEMLKRLQNTMWRCSDFELFLREAAPASSDLVFVDPPYDSEFSDYDNRSFGRSDQERLKETLEALSASVMIVIKDTPMIRSLYRPDRWQVTESDKTYLWTIKSRNDRVATHLTITNY